MPQFITDAGSSLARIVDPGDPDWDAARGTFNVLIDQQPEAIAIPTNEREVAAVVRHARERGLRVAAQATGHNAGPLGSLDGTLILNTSALTGVSIDAAARRVRVGAATRWEQVVPQLSELGLAALHGSSPDVGIVGYSLGGGIGWLARKHGMQTNAVTAIELVTADGHLVRTDPTHEPELFWALRGGDGNFGVVTAIEFAVLPVRELYAGALFYPVEQTAEVVQAWTDLLPGLPDEITSWANVIHFPPFPEVPEPVRGRSFAIVMAALLGPEHEGRELLAPLLRLGPAMDTFAMQAPVAPRRAGDGPARSAAVPDRARARRRAVHRRDRRDRPRRRPRLGADAAPAAPHGRRPRAPRAGRGRPRDAAGRALRLRPRRRAGPGAEPAVHVAARRHLGRRRAAPRR